MWRVVFGSFKNFSALARRKFLKQTYLQFPQESVAFHVPDFGGSAGGVLYLECWQGFKAIGNQICIDLLSQGSVSLLHYFEHSTLFSI